MAKKTSLRNHPRRLVAGFVYSLAVLHIVSHFSFTSELLWSIDRVLLSPGYWVVKVASGQLTDSLFSVLFYSALIYGIVYSLVRAVAEHKKK